MEVLIVLVFVSLVLVTAAVLMFIMRVRDGDVDHGERLSLLPLEEDGRRGGPGPEGDVSGPVRNGGSE